MYPRQTFIGAVFVAAVLVGGCPQDDSQPDQPAFSVKIAVSATRGEAPLRVAVSGAASTSGNGEITGYLWDFAGQAMADTLEASHTFTTPGRFLIALTVTDETGAQATGSIEVRVAGADADGPTALIKSDVDGGPAPLTVRFVGSESIALGGDTIRDYYWDFGDGKTSRRPDPVHVFLSDGDFGVELRVVTGGGLEDVASKTIVASSGLTSLQFNGIQSASLPIGADEPLAQCTFEAWYRADEGGGGRLVSIGNGFTLDIALETGTITLTVAKESVQASAVELGGAWRHVAASFDGQSLAKIYLDGRPIGEAELSGEISPADLVIGRGFRGKMAEVRFWTIALDESAIARGMNTRSSGDADGLNGHWAIDEGAGQLLMNNVTVTRSGMLGITSGDDAADPAWSTDGPPLP